MNKTDKILWSSEDASYRDYEWLDDIRENLNIYTERPILIYADLGLWNGRRKGYRVINSAKISDLLYSDYDPTWYVDENHDFRCIDRHHDGTNYYLYRMYEKNIDGEDIEELLDKIYNGIATEEDVMAITEPVGPYIEAVYTWMKGE